MVFGIFVMTAMIPTIIGVNEASKGTRDHEKQRKEGARQKRCSLLAECNMHIDEKLGRTLSLDGAHLYLGPHGKIYMTKYPSPQLVEFDGGFYQHPDFPPGNTAGYVAISGETPPTLRWIYLDSKTHELRWGGKADTAGNICGSFDWTRDEQHVTLQGWEGWLALKISDDEKKSLDLAMADGQEIWRLYFDEHDDGADLPPGSEVMEITIRRI